MNIEFENIRTCLVDMPTTIKAYTILKNDIYTIVLNARLSDAENRQSYLHEVEHIRRGDYEKKSSADMIEFFAHKEE